MLLLKCLPVARNFYWKRKYWIEAHIFTTTKKIPLVCDKILLVYDLYIIVALSLVTGSIYLINESHSFETWPSITPLSGRGVFEQNYWTPCGLFNAEFRLGWVNQLNGVHFEFLAHCFVSNNVVYNFQVHFRKLLLLTTSLHWCMHEISCWIWFWSESDS